MQLYKFFMPVAVMALAAGFCACSDDDEAYTPGFEGVEGQVVLAPSADAEIAIVKTPGSIVCPNVALWGCTPRSRVNAAEDITVHFEIDPSLVADYNDANATDFPAMPDGIVTMSVSDATIPAGSSVAAEPVALAVTDNQQLLGQLTVGQTYVVPVRMTAVTKGTARLAQSVSNVSFVAFNMTEKMLNPEGTPLGTYVEATDRQEWTATISDDAYSYRDWSYPILNPGNASYGMYPEGSYIIFNLAKSYTFDGLFCTPWYNYMGYTPFRVGTEILISDDGNAWTSLGKIEVLTATPAFYASVTAQYIKLILGPGSYLGVTDFSIYAL